MRTKYLFVNESNFLWPLQKYIQNFSFFLLLFSFHKQGDIEMISSHVYFIVDSGTN